MRVEVNTSPSTGDKLESSSVRHAHDVGGCERQTSGQDGRAPVSRIDTSGITGTAGFQPASEAHCTIALSPHASIVRMAHATLELPPLVFPFRLQPSLLIEAVVAVEPAFAE